jgi:hypothetical protein
VQTGTVFALKVLLAVLVSVLAVAAAGVVVMHTPWGEDLLRKQVERRLEASLDAEVHLGDLDLTLDQVTLRDLSVRHNDGAYRLSLASGTLDLGLLALLERRVSIDRLLLHKPVVHLDRPAALSKVTAGVGERTGRPIGIEQLRIDQGRFIAAPKGTVPVHVRDIDAQGRARVDDALTVQIHLCGRTTAPVSEPLQIDANLRDGHGTARISLGDLLAVRASPRSGGGVALEVERLMLPPALMQRHLESWPIIVPLVVRGDLVLSGALVQGDLSIVPQGQAGGRVTLAGAVALDRPCTPEGLRLDARVANVGGVWRQGPSVPASVQVQVAPGSLRPAEISASVQAHLPPVPYRGRSFGPATLQTHLRDGQIRTLKLDAQLPGATVRAVGGTPVRLTLTVRDLARLSSALSTVGLDLPPASGRGTVRAVVNGPLLRGWSRLHGHVRGTFSRLRVEGVSASRVRMVARVQPVGPQGSSARHIVLSAAASLPERVRLHLRGLWRPTAARLRVAALTLAYPGARWRAHGPAVLGADGDRLFVRGLDLRTGTQRIAATMSYGPRHLDGQIRWSDVRLQALPSPLRPRSVGGRTDGLLLLAGSRSSPRIRGTVGLASGRLWTFRDADLRVTGRYAEGRTEGRLHARSPVSELKGTFDLPVSWPLPPSAPVTATLEVQRLPLGPLIPSLPGAWDIRGLVRGELQLRGTAARPILHVEASAPVLVLRGPDAAPQVAGRGQVQAHYERERLSVAARLASPSAGTAALHATTEARLSGWLTGREVTLEPMRAPIEGWLDLQRVDVRWVAWLTPALARTAGRVTAFLRLSGPLADPRIAGHMEWRDGRVVAAPTEQGN